jgi:hypothetical protein
MTVEPTGGGGPLTLLADGVSFAARPELAGRLGAPWVSLHDAPLTILVGVTGVGKSTALARLREQGVAFSLLPDRREVADRVVIGTMQVMDGQSPRPVTDRVARLDYTARYRKLFGGGLAHALTRLAIDPARWPPPLLFDGLRGREEVMHAADRLPRSRFIVLLAPDEVRVRRLLGRGDAFDRTAVAAAGDALAALRALPGIGSVFDAAQLGRLAALTGEGDITTERLVQQAAIVVAERRNYDPEEARRWLERLLPPERRLVIDTTEHDQEAVAERIAAWL